MTRMRTVKPWDGVIKLPRPIDESITAGPWVDIFYRTRTKTWVVWSLLPANEKTSQHHQAILLGGFHDRTDAQFAADTVMSFMRKGDGYLPLTMHMVDESEDVVDLLHSVSHYADEAPWVCEHRQSELVLAKFSKAEIETLTQSIEALASSVQDWRIMVMPGEPDEKGDTFIPAFMRIKNKKVAAAIALAPSMFVNGKIAYWLNNKEHVMKIEPVKDAYQMVLPWAVPLPMLDQLYKVMKKCDAVLKKKHGSSSNAIDLMDHMREESLRTSTRLIAHAFGTGDRVGEA